MNHWQATIAVVVALVGLAMLGLWYLTGRDMDSQRRKARRGRRTLLAATGGLLAVLGIASTLAHRRGSLSGGGLFDRLLAWLRPGNYMVTCYEVSPTCYAPAPVPATAPADAAGNLHQQLVLLEGLEPGQLPAGALEARIETLTLDRDTLAGYVDDESLQPDQRELARQLCVDADRMLDNLRNRLENLRSGVSAAESDNHLPAREDEE
jgi:hypothetical protein